MYILLASKHKLVVEALSHLLTEVADCYICGVIESIDTISKSLELNRCDIIILTDPAFDCPTPVVLQKLQSYYKEIPVVLVTCAPELRSPSLLFKYSVSSILTRNCEVAELHKALKSAVIGKPYVTPIIAEALAADLCKTKAPQKQLSPRESEVLSWVARGATTGEIAKALSLSTKTVSTHKASIKNRLDLRTTSDMIRYAIEQELLPIPAK